MRVLRVEIDGAFEFIPAVRAAGRLWLHWRGETYVIADSPDRAAGRAAGSTTVKSGATAAPMPGKITRVACAVGDVVTPGRVLVVMEAMKMEYTLEAEITGEVHEVNVAEGAQVGLGQILIRVGPPK